MRIHELFWNEENIAHLWAAHQVTPDEIEEALFGLDAEEPTYRIRRDGDFYCISGETGSGRLLNIVGELLENKRFRVFGARDMTQKELRAYRKRK